MNEKEMIMAKLNKESYKDPSVRMNIGSFEYQPFISNREVAVYMNGGRVYIIYKGTSNKENVITDLHLINDITDRTFRQAIMDYETVKRTFPRKVIEVSGHSLGGSKALYISKEKNVRAIVFNPFTPSSTGKMYHIVKNNPIATIFVNRDDLLSNKMLVINPPNVVVMVLKSNRTAKTTHSIDSYLDPNLFIY